MRKDPEKKQAGKERRKKRLAAIISICLSIAVVITAIAGTIAYTMTNQLPQDEKQFSEKERKVLLQTFQTVTSEKKQPLRRVIDSQNPLNLVNYYGDEPLLTLWNSIPENQQPYTCLLYTSFEPGGRDHSHVHQQADQAYRGEGHPDRQRRSRGRRPGIHR